MNVLPGHRRQAIYVVVSLACLLGLAMFTQPKPIAATARARAVTHRRSHTESATKPTTPAAPAAQSTPAVAEPAPAPLPAPAASDDCPNGTDMQVVAHEDDDILFMNPTVQSAVAAGQCITTVYVTAGDAGQSSYYVQSRQAGMRAAYASMAGVPDGWSRQFSALRGHPVSQYTLDANPRIRLLFMGLPDGDVDGSGYAIDHHESLLQLFQNPAASIHTRGNESSYTAAELTATLADLIGIFKPTVLNTQAFQPDGLSGNDHSDHQIVGLFTTNAAKTAGYGGSMQHFYGYQLNSMPENLTPEQTAAKQAVFGSYAAHDGFICNNQNGCGNESTYQNYFSRQYQQAPN